MSKTVDDYIQKRNEEEERKENARAIIEKVAEMNCLADFAKTEEEKNKIYEKLEEWVIGYLKNFKKGEMK